MEPTGYRADSRSSFVMIPPHSNAARRSVLNGYSVIPEGSQLVIKFQNNTGPLSLVLQPNGNLTGSGTVEVAGRKAIQSPSSGIDYLAHNASCALGILQASK